MKWLALGPAGTNGHRAVLGFCEQGGGFSQPEIAFAKTNQQVLERFARGEADYAVVPMHNLSNGHIRGVMEWYYQNSTVHNFYVIGELKLGIEHHILVHPDNKSPLTELISHEEVFNQCSRYLSSLKVSTRAVESTAAAAKRVADAGPDSGLGAIASRLTAQTYNLGVYAEHVENEPDNYTAFHLLGRSPAEVSGNDATAILFKLPNRPGALYGVLGILNAIGVNNNSLHSIPLGKRDEFGFYIEFNGHREMAKVGHALQVINDCTRDLLILGSYPVYG